MELVEGENYQSLQGLDHAHQRGIVHRDLKPSNTLLTTDNRVKILDFGLAQDPNWTSSISGTPKYILPEAILGQPTDPRSDVYSLGATFYKLLVGRAPFTEGNLLMHHLHTAGRSRMSADRAARPWPLASRRTRDRRSDLRCRVAPRAPAG